MINTSIKENKNIEIRDVSVITGSVQKKEKKFDYFAEGNISHSQIPFIIHFKEDEIINLLEYKIKSDEEKNIKIIILSSDKSENWQRVPILNETTVSGKRILNLPLIFCDRLQVIFFKDEFFGFYNFGFEELKIRKDFSYEIKTSSNGDRLWVGENLFDGREDYGWSSAVFEKPTNQEVGITLSQAYFLREIRLKSVHDFPNCFPSGFQIHLSNDRNNWQAIASEGNFYTSSGTWVKWTFNPVKTRFIKITIDGLYRLKKEEYQAKILEMDILAVPENIYLEIGKSTDSMASELLPGKVVLSEINGVSPNKVVQANDPRIRPATEISPGIMQFARDNENRPGVAVQGNDSRLKISTSSSPGIVQLARNGEDRDGVAVQGSDQRLQRATEDNYGIVKLAGNGVETFDGVVRASDSRLKMATESRAGIVQLAKDGENRERVVVQGNDSRLRMASGAWPGIVQLAESGEKNADKALRSNDSRLEEGSESIPGRVRFAKDRESAALKAVQGNDSRLSPATEENQGIVRFAPQGMEKPDAAVMANDPRLKDARKPLPHEHPYADKDHDFNSHPGSLNLAGEMKISMGDSYQIPNLKDFILSAENKGGYAAAFRGGVVSRGEDNPALSTLAEAQPGIVSRSKEKPAGIFFSERDFALYMPDKNGDLKGSGLSLKTEGKISSNGGLEINGRGRIAISWDRFSSEVFQEGDLLTVGEKGTIEKMKKSGQTCVGVYLKDSDVVLNQDGRNKEKSLFLGISGILPIKINGKIKSGELIGLSGKSNIPGVGESLNGKNSERALAISFETCDKEKERVILGMLLR